MRLHYHPPQMEVQCQWRKYLGYGLGLVLQHVFPRLFSEPFDMQHMILLHNRSVLTIIARSL